MIRDKYSITDELGLGLSACDVTGSFLSPLTGYKIGGMSPSTISSIYPLKGPLTGGPHVACQF